MNHLDAASGSAGHLHCKVSRISCSPLFINRIIMFACDISSTCTRTRWCHRSFASIQKYTIFYISALSTWGSFALWNATQGIRILYYRDSSSANDNKVNAPRVRRRGRHAFHSINYYYIFTAWKFILTVSPLPLSLFHSSRLPIFYLHPSVFMSIRMKLE